MLTELAFLSDFSFLGDEAEDKANIALYKALKEYEDNFR